MALQTHYDNLKVDILATQEEIKEAYQALLAIYNPEGHPPEVKRKQERMIKIINEAYNVLTDPILKTEHDIWISKNILSIKGMEAKMNKEREAQRNMNNKRAVFSDLDYITKGNTETLKVSALIAVGVALFGGYAVYRHEQKQPDKTVDVVAMRYGEQMDGLLGKISYPKQLDEITTILNVKREGLNLVTDVKIDDYSTNFQLEVMARQLYGTQSKNIWCTDEEFSKLPIVYKYRFTFTKDNVHQELEEPLNYLCG